MNETPKKFIDFIITQNCTFKCKYCSQSKIYTKNPKHASKNTIKSFYKLLKKIDKDYEITITGGEALLHPDFFEIIENIKLLDFKINLITNLSFNFNLYKEIFAKLEDNLNRFDISFHIDEILNFDSMLEKLEKIISIIPKNTKTTFYIPLYKIDEKKERKIEKILEIANKYQKEYSFQKIRFLDKYTKEENKKFISAHKKIKSYSNFCYAGSKSAVIYENGDVYRCYSSRFNKSNYLGNINNKNFKLLNAPQVCTNKFCTCPKPMNYNQITESKNSKKAFFLNCINKFYFPFLLIRNFNIAKTKFNHFFGSRG